MKKEDLDEIVDEMEAMGEETWHRNYYLIKYRMKTVMPRIKGPRVLEMGCGFGEITRLLAIKFLDLTSMDGSEKMVEEATKHLERDGHIHVPILHTLFEDFTLEKYPWMTKYDDILMSCILEHVDDPVEVLKIAKSWLKPKGRIHIVVPNALSINRMVGRQAGMIEHEFILHAKDRLMGHKRVYWVVTLAEEVGKAGLKTGYWEGIFFKPLSDAQMIDLFNEEMMDAFYEVGKRFSRYCTEIYMVSTNE